MANLILWKEMEIKSDLRYNEACKLLKQACDSEASKYITFSIVANPQRSFWSLLGRPNEITREFLAKPEAFIMEI